MSDKTTTTDPPSVRIATWLREHTEVLIDGRPVGEVADEHAAWEKTDPQYERTCAGPVRWGFGHALVPICMACGACVWTLGASVDHRGATWENDKDPWKDP